MAPAPPIILPPVTSRVLLDYVLTSTSYPTTLLVCSPRTAFLSSLLSSDSTSSLQFLTPTLQLLSISPHIQTIYTPTLSHLRAWLAVADSDCSALAPALPIGNKAATDATKKGGNGRSQLVVWGLVNMHQGTSEWSVQGLGSTTAALVEAGKRMGRRVVIVEEAESEPNKEGAENEGESTEGDETIGNQGDLEEIYGLNDGGELESANRLEYNQSQQNGIFRKRLPMLNGSSRTDGNNAEAATWSGRTVEVGIVLKRWFRFTEEELLS
jgi:hypothetical protein